MESEREGHGWRMENEREESAVNAFLKQNHRPNTVERDQGL